MLAIGLGQCLLLSPCSVGKGVLAHSAPAQTDYAAGIACETTEKENTMMTLVSCILQASNAAITHASFCEALGFQYKLIHSTLTLHGGGRMLSGA